MRLKIACVLALWLVALIAGVTAQAPTLPSLTREEALLVRSVLLLQKQAQTACDDLAETKQYTALVRDVSELLKASGKKVDWATGKLAP